MSSLRENFLKKILSQPSAPFRETHVIKVLIDEFDANGVPYFRDSVGNIVVGVRSEHDYLACLRKPSPEPLRIFIAHTDHPGFHGTKWRSPSELEIQWHGGSPTELLEGARVWLADRSGSRGFGRIRSAELLPSKRAIQTAVIETSPELSPEDHPAESLFGGFGFREPVWQEGDLIYTKAADDLVGTFAIASLALDFWGGKKKKNAKASPPPFIGLLTRAEEVGFIGAIGHFELGWFEKAKRELLFVSLETSRTFPGADIGKGPVVRLGDRYTVFDPGALRVFSDLAQKTLPERHQRRIMDGGTCEATVAAVYGYPCVGISIPLGNYHNQSFEGGPDSRGTMGPAPEFVHLGDVTGLLDLCRALLMPKQPWKAPWSEKMKSFRKELKRYRPLLKQGK